MEYVRTADERFEGLEDYPFESSGDCGPRRWSSGGVRGPEAAKRARSVRRYGTPLDWPIDHVRVT